MITNGNKSNLWYSDNTIMSIDGSNHNARKALKEMRFKVGADQLPAGMRNSIQVAVRAESGYQAICFLQQELTLASVPILVDDGRLIALGYTLRGVTG